ncbi:hypothetical protein GCM10023195_12110 [Actinoallomurus liliacearum]|uniref:Oxygen sensor histidine kinase NreB n=1 Tax=Actinoallomurus liliacearum TaxID=1080073 RepID=A0ABP8TFN2_9ACTN
MALSYVMVSVAAVLVVEAVLLLLVAPRVLTGAGDTGGAEAQAAGDAKTLSLAAVDLGLATPGVSDQDLLAGLSGQASAQTGIGDARMRDGVALEALAARDGRIVLSSAPGRNPVGSPVPVKGAATTARSGLRKQQGRSVAWASSPVVAWGAATAARTGRPAGHDRRVIGMVYVQLPAGRRQAAGHVGRLLLPGLIVLLLIVPVGVLFGLLSTGALIRRIRRLADVTTAMADGDFQARIPESGGDEVGRLEEAFNRMAERLEAAVQAERDAAASDGRRAERSRIARELHDSISQDLFSLRLLAGGLGKALAAETDLRDKAESMERTVDRTMREMQALLLELRPVAIEDAGLMPALTELCRAYEARLGVPVRTDLETVRLEPAVEHAVLRIAQEALGNAVRHGEPGLIELSLTAGDGCVVVRVRDDGRGFDRRSVDGHGMGLDLMRERATELGGTFEVVSAPGEGTTVTASIPDGTP